MPESVDWDGWSSENAVSARTLFLKKTVDQLNIRGSAIAALWALNNEFSDENKFLNTVEYR